MGYGDSDRTGKVDLSNVMLLGDGVTCEQYLDGGISKDYSLEKIRVLKKTKVN